MIHYALTVALVLSNGANGTSEANSSDRLRSASTVREYTQASEMTRGLKWGYSTFFLVNERNVQAELRLTSEQMRAIEQLAGEYAERLHATAGSPREAVNRDAASQTDRLRAAHAALMTQYGDAAIRVLSKEQQRRLDQVAFQLCGFEALRYREVREDLKLTDVQKSQIGDIRVWLVEESKKAHVEYMQTKRDAAGFNAATDKILGEAKAKAIAILSSEQRQLLASMEGPEINFGRRHLKMQIRKPPAVPKGNQ